MTAATTRGWPAGVGRILLDETDSTNAEAARRAATAEPPVWIAARRQSAARGRAGRSWESPQGNLAATLMLATGRPPAERARFSFHAALAVADVLDALAPGAAVGLKWPNDVLLAGGKVSGILLESYGAAAPGRADLAIGVGLNLAHHPDPAETRWRPVSVASVTGRAAPEPEAALALLATALARWVARDRAEGFAAIRAAWLARAARMGERIVAALPEGPVGGIFRDVDERGALVLDTGRGLRVIAAADVHFPDRHFPDQPLVDRLSGGSPRG